MKHTTRIMNIVQRSLDGPIIEEEDFNNKNVSQGLARVVAKYEIKVDKDRIVNFDDDLADRVWDASVDFLASCGVYCQNTGRVILHSREEIETILKKAPDNVWIGAGTDAIHEVVRGVEDPRRRGDDALRNRRSGTHVVCPGALAVCRRGEARDTGAVVRRVPLVDRSRLEEAHPVAVLQP